MHPQELTDDELHQAADEACTHWWRNSTNETELENRQAYLVLMAEVERRFKLKEEGKPDVLP